MSFTLSPETVFHSFQFSLISDLIEVSVKDRGGEGAEQAGDVAEAEPGSEQVVVTLRVGSRADTNIYGVFQKTALLCMFRGQFFKS